MPALIRLLLAFVLTVPPASSLLAHESADHERSTTVAKTIDAKGIVFDDRNGNGKRDDSEPGLADIRVSNGKDIVRSDDQGKYELKIDEDDIIFVIKPRDWVTPLDEDNLPQFYYVHKPAGSPATFKYPGVDPTGPLPKSIDFPLRQRPEPETFKAIMFGDPQPRDISEVEYIAHDVIEQIIAEQAHGAAFGVTLGDIAFDDLTTMQPLNQAIALIGIPWYNVIGNHDLNLEAKTDSQSDETFERIYGPAYYSFDHGPTHFLILDDVIWEGSRDGKKGHYHGGLGETQMEFIRNDLAAIAEDQLVVLMMHVPLTDMKDRQELYRMIEHRPATVSISAHTHYMEHRLIGKEDGWMGPKKHHHIVNVTVCGSWWRGHKDERGIPHATMSDGGPNGYSIMEFNGNEYSIELRGANRPADYQMHIYAPQVVKNTDLSTTVVMANVFNGSTQWNVAMRVDRQGKWRPMEQIKSPDPAVVEEKMREETLTDRTWTDLPKTRSTPHMWRGMMPTTLNAGTHLIEVRGIDPSGKELIDHRILRVETQP